MKRRPRVRGTGRIFTASFSGQRFSPYIFILLALTLFGYSVARPGSFSGVRTMAADAAAPVLGAINRPVQYAADYVRAVSGLASMQEENARLQEENARLREWYQTAMTLRTENESLRNLLNITLPAGQRFVSARVIGDSGGSYVKTFLVDAGMRDGVKKDYTVLAGEGVIGRIIEAGNHSARVLLMTDINSRIPVLIEGENIRAILGGNNTDHPVLNHLPPETKLSEGARVITSGHGALFPFGLPVGEVIRNEHGEWAVKPFADTRRVTFVRIAGGDSRLETGGL